MNNLDVNQLMSMLSKMDKKDLERGLAQASKILNSKDNANILEQLNNNSNNLNK